MASTATAAAAPFAEALARAAEPVRAIDDVSNFGDQGFRLHADNEPELPAPAVEAPQARVAKKVEEPKAAPAAEDGISFGKRADADIKAVAITPNMVRGYTLPRSSLR